MNSTIFLFFFLNRGGPPRGMMRGRGGPGGMRGGPPMRGRGGPPSRGRGGHFPSGYAHYDNIFLTFLFHFEQCIYNSSYSNRGPPEASGGGPGGAPRGRGGAGGFRGRGRGDFGRGGGGGGFRGRGGPGGDRGRGGR